jgi:multidrug efflux system outer membrane protein
MREKMLSVVFASLLASGGLVGAADKPARVFVPELWTVAPARGTSPKPPEVDAWWASFRDAELQSLVERAVERNLDLELALERVREARAAAGIARSRRFPSVDFNASAIRLRGGFNQGVVRAVPSSAGTDSRASLLSPFETGSIQGSLGASWELDIFGGIRRGAQAAAADAVAAAENSRAVRVILLADVGRFYAELRGLQTRLQIAQSNIRTQEETLELTRIRAKAGLATELDVTRAEAQLETTRAAVPDLRAGIEMSIHRLGVLLGEEPGALRTELEGAQPILAAAPDIGVGVPSDLLKRRPDIRRVEAQLQAAMSRVGEARADLFPRFFLTGTAGRQGTELRALAFGAGNFFSAGPGISLPIFNRGRIRSNIAVQQSRERAAVIAYQSTVLTALEEVQNALVQYAEEQERRDRLARAVEASRLAVDLATERYRAGLADFLEVLEAQRDLYAGEDNLARSRTELAADIIALYRALGGGWSASGPS